MFELQARYLAMAWAGAAPLPAEVITQQLTPKTMAVLYVVLTWRCCTSC
jgi:hypothetical protein